MHTQCQSKIKFLNSVFKSILSTSDLIIFKLMGDVYQPLCDVVSLDSGELLDFTLGDVLTLGENHIQEK